MGRRCEGRKVRRRVERVERCAVWVAIYVRVSSAEERGSGGVRTVSQVPVATRILSSPPRRKMRASSVTSRRSLRRSKGVNVGASAGAVVPGGGVFIIVKRVWSLVVMPWREPVRGR